MEKSVDELAETIWNYLRLDQELVRADAVVAFGSHDRRVAERGAELFLDGWAPWLICSGRSGGITEGLWNRSEAEVFASLAMEKGVPADRILLEKESRNTGENIRFTRKLAAAKGLTLKRMIGVHKPYMERRLLAALEKQWPEVEAVVTSPRLGYRDYPDGEISRDEFICTMLGDLQRMRIYAEMGFQSVQEIPPAVWEAFSRLVELGYDQRLVDRNP